MEGRCDFEKLRTELSLLGGGEEEEEKEKVGVGTTGLIVERAVFREDKAPTAAGRGLLDPLSDAVNRRSQS